MEILEFGMEKMYRGCDKFEGIMTSSDDCQTQARNNND